MFCNTPVRMAMGLTERVSRWGPRAATGGLVWRCGQYHGAARARADYVRF